MTLAAGARGSTNLKHLPLAWRNSKRFYFGLVVAPHPVFPCTMVPGVGDALERAKATMAETFRSRALVERVENVELPGLDAANQSSGGKPVNDARSRKRA
ncbi:hypothetical protein P7D22_17020 [Lichenihabitans sp. Uapishka_5]|uniref:hypothetical protein n=1 Tax=Lichenihabitans sp. Uapishka_5 TaxID=3037302 RepID=UPI0029E7ECE8|nr:hypothetical protein [Lichenihabitans sp. Uapishka_5]MDX7952870.1 hypothetical protein [Lichenihabitans sp. Uapishka_5]